MGKDSKYYKEKKKEQTLKLRELIRQLPGFAADYIHSKEVTTQTSTLISYSYDLLTFFRFMVSQNPALKSYAVKDLPLSILDQITSEDIVEYQRYLELSVEGEYHENGKKAIAREAVSAAGNVSIPL